MSLDALPAAAVPVDDAEFARRRAALRAGMRRRRLGAVVLASPESIYHLTGLDHLGYFAVTVLIVPVDGRVVLVARRMERHTLAAQVPGAVHLAYADGRDPAPVAAKALRRMVSVGARVGVEEQSMFLPPAVLRVMRAGTPGVTWVECSRLAADLREVKSSGELGLVRRAAAVSSRAMAAAIAAAGVGVNERRIAADTHAAMIAAGGQPPGFVPLIRSMSRLAQEHVTWDDHVLSSGEGVFVELSGCVRRYHAPLSRIVYCGAAPAGAAAATAAAQHGFAAALAALRPGARTGDVYRAWEDAVADATGVRQRRHHCGYLTGIGFAPSWVGGARVRGLSAAGRGVIAAGMVVHLMSWVSAPVPAVRSDTAIVTPDGAVVATDAPAGVLICD